MGRNDGRINVRELDVENLHISWSAVVGHDDFVDELLFEDLSFLVTILIGVVTIDFVDKL